MNVPQVKNRLPRFAIQACSAPVEFEKEQSPDFFLQISVRRLLFVNSLPESSFVSRGATTFDIFRRGVSPVEADPGERRVSGRRIERSTVSLIAD